MDDNHKAIDTDDISEGDKISAIFRQLLSNIKLTKLKVESGLNISTSVFLIFQQQQKQNK